MSRKQEAVDLMKLVMSWNITSLDFSLNHDSSWKIALLKLFKLK